MTRAFDELWMKAATDGQFYRAPAPLPPPPSLSLSLSRHVRGRSASFRNVGDGCEARGAGSPGYSSYGSNPSP